ncbi:hypothetical protein BV20DRAFT_323511 [Pilatotrama ljubarskyi]|nr:hypothetical protein BV20DRAFT_323511 [Pilatotrama ljubarskyi]
MRCYLFASLVATSLYMEIFADWTGCLWLHGILDTQTEHTMDTELHRPPLSSFLTARLIDQVCDLRGTLSATIPLFSFPVNFVLFTPQPRDDPRPVYETLGTLRDRARAEVSYKLDAKLS